jgi:hypothetical protein
MDVPVEQVDAATETARLPVPPTGNLIPQWLTTGEVDPVDTLTDTQGDTAVESVSDAPVDAPVEAPVETVGPPSASWEPVEVAAQRVALRAATSLDRVAMLFQRLAESLRVSAKEASNPSAVPMPPPQAGG